MNEQKLTEFNMIIMSHLDAAYNYAFWLSKDEHNAEDLTQEACMRAFAAFEQYKMQYPKAWLMTIVRHTFFNQEDKKKRRGEVIYLDMLSQKHELPAALIELDTPECLILRNTDVELVRQCIDELADEYREVIMLRELEGFSYNEISQIIDSPVGTVMSRLSRARKQLKSILISNGYTRKVIV